MKAKAFTLIELLIVVAIIAILAAIAVPNFLEAQTRSKVTRVKADMRTIVVALESYRTDNNKYINPVWPQEDPGGSQQGGWLYMESDSGIFGCGRQLTSPVSYLSSIPIDPFWSLYMQRASRDWGGAFHLVSALYWSSTKVSFDWAVPDPPIVYRNVSYYMQSPGPNLMIYAHDPGFVYDPTNGTVSGGNMMRTQRDPTGQGSEPLP